MTKLQERLFLWGQIKQSKVDNPEMSISDLMKKHRAKKNFVERALKYRGGRAKTKRATRSTPDHIKKRRAIVRELCQRTHTNGGFKIPEFPSAPSIAAELRKRYKIDVDPSTVYRDLRAMNFKSYVRRKVPTRDAKLHKRRLDFAKKYRRVDPRRLIFSDEHIESSMDFTARRCYAKKSIHVCPRHRGKSWNGASLMIWGAIGYNFKSKVIFFPKLDKDGETKTTAWRLNGKRYRQRVLPSLLFDLSKDKRPLSNFIFMQDGASCHVAKETLLYLQRKGLETIDGWPPHSPDLNPIENLWNSIKRRVSKLTPRTLEQLKAAVKKVWDELTYDEINRYVCSFTKKLDRCIERQGQC